MLAHFIEDGVDLLESLRLAVRIDGGIDAQHVVALLIVLDRGQLNAMPRVEEERDVGLGSRRLALFEIVPEARKAGVERSLCHVDGAIDREPEPAEHLRHRSRIFWRVLQRADLSIGAVADDEGDAPLIGLRVSCAEADEHLLAIVWIGRENVAGTGGGRLKGRAQERAFARRQRPRHEVVDLAGRSPQRGARRNDGRQTRQHQGRDCVCHPLDLPDWQSSPSAAPRQKPPQRHGPVGGCGAGRPPDRNRRRTNCEAGRSM